MGGATTTTTTTGTAWCGSGGVSMMSLHDGRSWAGRHYLHSEYAKRYKTNTNYNFSRQNIKITIHSFPPGLHNASIIKIVGSDFIADSDIVKYVETESR